MHHMIKNLIRSATLQLKSFWFSYKNQALLGSLQVSYLVDPMARACTDQAPGWGQGRYAWLPPSSASNSRLALHQSDETGSQQVRASARSCVSSCTRLQLNLSATAQPHPQQQQRLQSGHAHQRCFPPLCTWDRSLELLARFSRTQKCPVTRCCQTLMIYTTAVVARDKQLWHCPVPFVQYRKRHPSRVDQQQKENQTLVYSVSDSARPSCKQEFLKL